MQNIGLFLLQWPRGIKFSCSAQCPICVKIWPKVKILKFHSIKKIYYELVYVLIKIVNKSDKLLFVKKNCLLHLKVGLIFYKISFLLEKVHFCRKDFNFDLIFKYFLILSWFVRDLIQEKALKTILYTIIFGFIVC